MRLALLISEVPPRPLLDAIRSLPGSPLVGWWTSEETYRSFLQKDFPTSRFVDRWDELLIEPLDATIFCGSSPELLSAARQIAQRGLRIFIPTATSSSPVRLFEFTPLWQESPHLLIPMYFSGMEQASRNALERFVKKNYGPVWKLEFHRVLNTSPQQNPLQSQEIVDSMLLQDLHWICKRIGFPQHVTMQTSGPAGDPAEAMVLLDGETTPEVRWTLRSHPGPDEWRLKLSGQAGEMEFFSDSLQQFDLKTGENTVAHGPFTDLMTQIQHSLEEGIPSGSSRSAWLELIQLAEIGAVARRSQLRRRTLDIHFGEASERSQFKTQMTVIGCGALLWTIFGMIGLLILGGLFDPRDREFRQSAAAGFVIPHELFEEGRSGLTPAGRIRIGKIAANWSSTSPVLIVEKSPRRDRALDEKRADRIAKELAADGVQNSGARTVLRPLRGEWFVSAMKVAWVLVFAPLTLVLLLQLLILIARGQMQTSGKTPENSPTPQEI